MPAPRPPLHTVLRDGTRLTLRPIAADDKPRLRASLRFLSPATLYRRFFAPITDLSDERLRALAEVDQVDHVAWCALDEDHPEVPLVGVGRWVRLAEDPTIAETALTVVDRYQGRGLGTLLLALLNETARAGGVRTLRSIVLGENQAFIATLQRYGASARHESHGNMRLDLPVYAAGDTITDVPYARAVAEVRALLASA